MWWSPRQYTKLELILWYMIFGVFMCGRAARATEAPACAYAADRQTVACDTESFRRIMTRCSEGIAGQADCQVRLDAALKAWQEAKDGLTACTDRCQPPSTVRPVAGYIAGLAGLGALAFVPTIEGRSTQLTVSVTGVVAIITGLWFVLPRDR